MDNKKLTGITFTKFREQIEEIKNLVVDGLSTDGGHHKQWYLEEILKKLGYSKKAIEEEIALEEDWGGFEFDEGIPP